MQNSNEYPDYHSVLSIRLDDALTGKAFFEVALYHKSTLHPGLLLTWIIEAISYFCIFYPDYRVGSSDGWSALYNFNATKEGTAWSPRFAIYGDLGVDNAQSLSKLQKEVQGGQYDAILHVGQYC